MTRRRLTFLLAAGLLCGAAPVGAQITCVGGGCGGGGGATADPLTLGNIVGTTSSCSVGAPDAANSVCLGSNAITGEGSTADTSETVLAFGDASADNTLTLKGTAAGVEATVTTGALLTGAGTGTGRVSVGGVLCKGAPAQATTGTSEEVLATCTIPANTLTANGSALHVHLFTHTAANGNSKTISVRVGGIGGTIVATTGGLTSNNLNVYSLGPITIKRTAATTATSNWYWMTVANTTATGGAGGAYSVRAAAITWANANDLVITGTTPTASGDLTLDSYSVSVEQ